MTYQQEARDANDTHEIAMSCSVILRHASYVGVTADKLVRVNPCAAPGLMDNLNEAEGVLKRALGRIEQSKQVLMSKTLQAAE